MPDPIRLGFPVSFLEAIKWAENRKAVLPETYYGELAKELRSTAFTVSGISRLDVIEQIMTSLADQTKAGATFASWKKWVADNAPEVFQLPKGRAETIFRNAIQTNYNAGRWEQQWAARDVFPYLMWSAINDARTRPTHRALSGIIRRIDDPFWQRVGYPPAGHNCRCTTIALTEKQAQRRSGVDTGLNKPVTPDMHADPGWEYHPVLQQTRMEDIAKQKLDRMGAMMRIALENAARAAPNAPTIQPDTVRTNEEALQGLDALPQGELRIEKQVPFPIEFDQDHIPFNLPNVQESNVLPLRSVNLSNLIATQSSVRKSRVKPFIEDLNLGLTSKIEGYNADYPWIIKYKEKLYIIDGHHRLTAAWLKGIKSMTVRYQEIL